MLDADWMLVAMSLSRCRLGRFSNSKPGSVDAKRMMRSVGSLRWLVFKATESQWLKLVMSLCTCAWAVKPLSEFFSWRLLGVQCPFVWLYPL